MEFQFCFYRNRRYDAHCCSTTTDKQKKEDKHDSVRLMKNAATMWGRNIKEVLMCTMFDRLLARAEVVIFFIVCRSPASMFGLVTNSREEHATFHT